MQLSKELLHMKNYLILSALFTALLTDAQTSWQTNGNNVSTSDFIGSTNNEPLLFKANNSDVVTISTGQSVGIGNNKLPVSPIVSKSLAVGISNSVENGCSACFTVGTGNKVSGLASTILGSANNSSGGGFWNGLNFISGIFNETNNCSLTFCLGGGIESNNTTSTFTIGTGSYSVGKLINNVSNSFLVGFNAQPELFVKPNQMGIGTSNPLANYALHIANGGDVILKPLSSSDAVSITFDDAQNGMIWGAKDGIKGLLLSSGSTNPEITIIENRVGINTTMPKETFQIGDEITIHNGGTKYFGRNTYYDGTQNRRIQGGYSTLMGFSQYGDIFFYTAEGGVANSVVNGWEKLTIKNDGRIVIGDPNKGNKSNGSPITDFKLIVTGGILADKVKVAVPNTLDWADNVFEPGYSLMPLADVKKSIEEHCHLPGVPSADEITANGIDVVKMNATLLRKVEELTLYVINLEEKLNRK